MSFEQTQGPFHSIEDAIRAAGGEPPTQEEMDKMADEQIQQTDYIVNEQLAAEAADRAGLMRDFFLKGAYEQLGREFSRESITVEHVQCRLYSNLKMAEDIYDSVLVLEQDKQVIQHRHRDLMRKYLPGYAGE